MVVGRHAHGVITLLVATGQLVAGADIELAQDEAHHLRVRRAAMDETVRLVDGAGAVASASLRAAGKEIHAVVAAVELVARGPTITLGVAAGDKERFGFMVEKATELGATRIVPVVTEHSAAVASRIRSAQLPKLQRRALEAIKQCGAAWAPEIAEPMSLFHFATAPWTGARWLADAAGVIPTGLPDDGALTIAVGPEGGFTFEERDTLIDSRFVPVRLGPHILRFETAAIAALAAVWQLYPRAKND